METGSEGSLRYEFDCAIYLNFSTPTLMVSTFEQRKSLAEKMERCEVGKIFKLLNQIKSVQ